MKLSSRLVLLGLLLLCPGLCASDRRKRSKICGVDCMWLDELKQKKQLPLQAFMSVYDVHSYCSPGVEKETPWGYLHSWSAMYVTIRAKPSNGVNVAEGNSSLAVKALLKEGVSYPPSNMTTVIEFSIYNTSCVGIRHSEVVGDTVWYILDAKKGVVPLYPILFGFGMVLLFSAPFLSRSVPLYYGTGITIGILASMLILLYVFSKFVPKKNILGLGLLAGGYTIFASFFYWLVNNATEFALANWPYVAGYVCLAAFISFAVLYRMGPVSNPRSLDLIQWALQLVGVVFLFCASPHVEVSAGIVVSALLLYWIPYRWNPVFLVASLLCRVVSAVLSPVLWCARCLNPLRLFRRRPRLRFLTMEEYEQQGRVETTRALRELREHCRSSGMWDTISNLENPKRFTEFLSGRDHVTAEQRVEHDWSFVVDDSSESDTVDYSDGEESTPSPHRTPSSPSSSRYTTDDSVPSPSFSPSPSPSPSSREQSRTQYRTKYICTSTPRSPGYSRAHSSRH